MNNKIKILPKVDENKIEEINKINKIVEIKQELRNYNYKCDICKATFMHRLNYDLHLSYHNDNDNCCKW